MKCAGKRRKEVLISRLRFGHTRKAQHRRLQHVKGHYWKRFEQTFIDKQSFFRKSWQWGKEVMITFWWCSGFQRDFDLWLSKYQSQVPLSQSNLLPILYFASGTRNFSKDSLSLLGAGLCSPSAFLFCFIILSHIMKQWPAVMCWNIVCQPPKNKKRRMRLPPSVSVDQSGVPMLSQPLVSNQGRVRGAFYRRAKNKLFLILFPRWPTFPQNTKSVTS